MLSELNYRAEVAILCRDDPCDLQGYTSFSHSVSGVAGGETNGIGVLAWHNKNEGGARQPDVGSIISNRAR